jgi:hypothetical protein
MFIPTPNVKTAGQNFIAQAVAPQMPITQQEK